MKYLILIAGLLLGCEATEKGYPFVTNPAAAAEQVSRARSEQLEYLSHTNWQFLTKAQIDSVETVAAALGYNRVESRRTYHGLGTEWEEVGYHVSFHREPVDSWVTETIEADGDTWGEAVAEITNYLTQKRPGSKTKKPTAKAGGHRIYPIIFEPENYKKKTV